MENLTPLPDNDPDASLARRINEGSGLDGEDALEQALVNYRDAAREIVPSSRFSTTLWKRVSPRPAAKLIVLRRALAAAAVVLVGFGIWALYPSGPSLVASALDEKQLVELDDGSRVTLRPNSKLFSSAENNYLLEGEAFFEVTHNPERRFVVATGSGRVSVLGTSFVVSTWDYETNVFLKEGVVTFEHARSAALDTLLPGQELLATSGGHTVKKSYSDGEDAMDWISGTLVFRAKPLRRIADELENHYGITVVVPESIETETLSGRIALSDSQTSLQDLATVLGGRIERGGASTFTLVFD